MNEVLLCSFPQSCYFRDHHIHREDFMYMYMCSIDSILGHFSFQNARFYTFSTLQILLSVDNSTYTGLAFLQCLSQACFLFRMCHTCDWMMLKFALVATCVCWWLFSFPAHTPVERMIFFYLRCSNASFPHAKQVEYLYLYYSEYMLLSLEVLV